jgi:outer membrane lipoprotein LolB
VHQTKRLLAAVLTVWSLAAVTSCTTMTPPAAKQSTVTWDSRKALLERMQNWQISGKIAVITAKDSGSASVEWSQHANQFTLSLYGPLGANGIKMNGGPGLVTLKTSDGKTASAPTAEQLLSQQWGWQLPLASLKYWVRGLPVPGAPSQTTFDSAHRLASLSQQGFNIQYQGYTTAGTLDLPQHISITSPTIKSKIIIYKWTVS